MICTEIPVKLNMRKAFPLRVNTGLKLKKIVWLYWMIAGTKLPITKKFHWLIKYMLGNKDTA